MSSAVIGAEGHVSICNVWHGRLLGAHDRDLSLQRHRIPAASTITIDWTAAAQQALLLLTDAPTVSGPSRSVPLRASVSASPAMIAGRLIEGGQHGQNQPYRRATRHPRRGNRP